MDAPHMGGDAAQCDEQGDATHRRTSPGTYERHCTRVMPGAAAQQGTRVRAAVAGDIRGRMAHDSARSAAHDTPRRTTMHHDQAGRHSEEQGHTGHRLNAAAQDVARAHAAETRHQFWCYLTQTRCPTCTQLQAETRAARQTLLQVVADSVPPRDSARTLEYREQASAWQQQAAQDWHADRDQAEFCLSMAQQLRDRARHLECFGATPRYRCFLGNDTQQRDGHTGQRAWPARWYYEPVGYASEVLWSIGYETLEDAMDAASAEGSR